MSAAQQGNLKDNMLTKKALYDKMAALAQASGMEVTSDVRALLEPLIDGSVSYEEHQILLKSMLEGSKP